MIGCAGVIADDRQFCRTDKDVVTNHVRLAVIRIHAAEPAEPEIANALNCLHNGVQHAQVDALSKPQVLKGEISETTVGIDSGTQPGQYTRQSCLPGVL